jgi:hypothetical protein
MIDLTKRTGPGSKLILDFSRGLPHCQASPFWLHLAKKFQNLESYQVTGLTNQEILPTPAQ